MDSEITQVPYRPKSRGQSVGTLVPINMSGAISRALDRLEAQVGSLDWYVAKNLSIGDETTLFSRFSAEQIDALALSFWNLERGEAIICGDQTGIGKGRFVAGVIEYARQHGHIPIFVTGDEKLYGDMLRDLRDIGVTNLRPLPTNTGLNLPLPDSRQLRTGDASAHRQLLNRLANSGELTGYDAIFTTYAQMQTVRGKDTDRRDFLRRFANRSILILDESHNAGGVAKRERDELGVVDRAEFTRELIERAAGVVYSSATYAKNPYTMTLYAAKTGMRHAVPKQEDLVEMVTCGGIPLQQILAAKLTEAGQYIRRERSYEGIEFAPRIVPVNHGIAENLATVMRQIMAFDQQKTIALKQFNKELKAQAKQQVMDQAIGEVGASSTNFTSIMHNVIAQTLLSLKAEATVQEALSALRRGEKPVIAVSNTMGSLIGQMAEAQDLKPGDPIDLNLGHLLLRYLERSREVVVKDYTGKISRQSLTDTHLGRDALELYADTLARIEATDWRAIPISPIDYIHHRLAQEGYSSNELTGREDRLDYGAGGPFYQLRGSRERSTATAIRNVKDFNTGELDVLILNRSGSTGISLHASATFSDRRPRRMIITQAETNIDLFMQMLGRIHRTGQVEKPRFTLLMGDIPAEKRPAAVLLKKMASLNANTQAARGSAFSLGNVTDFMNEYGDQVAVELMVRRPDWHAKLGYPFRELETLEETDPETIDYKGAIARVTGRIPLLPLAEQEQLYGLIEQEYRELLEQEQSLGRNRLEAETLGLDARTLARIEIIPATGTNPFTEAVYLERIDARSQQKPPTTLEVVNLVRGEMGLPVIAQIQEHDRAELHERAVQSSQERMQQLQERLGNYLSQVQTVLKAEERHTEAIQKAAAKFAHWQLRLEAQYQHVASILTKYLVGQPVRITGDGNGLEGLFHYGVVSGYRDRSVEGENPTLPGNWRIVIQVADGLRQLVLPLSRINTARSSSLNLETRETTMFDQDILELFDLKQGLARQHLQVLTGNIIRAYGEYGGKLINFTACMGNVRQGVLLPEGYDAIKKLEQQPVKMPSPADCLRFYEHLEGKGQLVTGDGMLKVIPVKGGLLLTTPRSKSQGGIYYLDEELIFTAGAEFYSSGELMRLDVSETKAQAVLNYLYENDTPLFAIEQRQKARQMLGIVLPSVDLSQTQEGLQILPPYPQPLEQQAMSQLENSFDTPAQPPTPEPEPRLQTHTSKASLNPGITSDQPTLSSVGEGFSPSLQQMRDWVADAKVLGKSPRYIARIKELSIAMLSGTAQFELPVAERNPEFVNPNFMLSDVALRAMDRDRQDSRALRSPTRMQLMLWFQGAQALQQAPAQIDHIKTLGGEQIRGTDQADLPPKARNPQFKNPQFTLSHRDFLDMKQITDRVFREHKDVVSTVQLSVER